MVKYKIFISGPAENDLYGIIRYISVQLSAPMTALKMADTIEKAIKDLAVMPQKYQYITDERLAAMGYRKLPVKNYIVFFTVNEKSKVIDIERILYARRDWQHIL